MKKILILTAISLACSTIIFSTTVFAAEAFKPMTLKFANVVPQNSWFGQQHQLWANEVEKRTEGKIKLRIFWMESLVKWKDMLIGVQSGIADMGWVSSTYHPSNLPLYITLANPFNYRDDFVAATMAEFDTLDNEPNLRAEMERENLILVFPHIGGQMQIGTKKCFDSIKNIKGKTIRTYGGGRFLYYQYLGANPIFMPYSDIYEALDRGTVDSADMNIMLSETFKHYEVMKCLYMTNSGGGFATGIFMNRNLFKRLPKDIQETFLELKAEYGFRYIKGIMDLEAKFYNEWTTKHGVVLKNPSPEDQRTNIEAGAKAQQAFLKQQESEGHTAARKVWDYYMAALKKYEDQRAKKK